MRYTYSTGHGHRGFQFLRIRIPVEAALDRGGPYKLHAGKAVRFWQGSAHAGWHVHYLPISDVSSPISALAGRPSPFLNQACPSLTIVFKLYDDVVLKTADNFRKLAQGLDVNGEPSSKGHTYAGSGFYRLIPSFMLQGGDFTNHRGTGGVSIYGAKFKDENFQLKAQANQARAALHGQRGPQHQFFIPAVVTSCLEGKHVVFTTPRRRSIENYDLIKTIEGYGSPSAASRPRKSRSLSPPSSPARPSSPPLLLRSGTKPPPHFRGLQENPGPALLILYFAQLSLGAFIHFSSSPAAAARRTTPAPCWASRLWLASFQNCLHLQNCLHVVLGLAIGWHRFRTLNEGLYKDQRA
ncbi:cyclophilin-like domain-containing protein [Mycena galericulata]|nr:cyclophilin-like domain-containing protein [Mycena galericulata]